MAGETDPFASITTTPEQARTFLERLTDVDDPLRDALQEDPRGTLRELGIAASPQLIPRTVELPSAEECSALLRRLDEAEEDWLHVLSGPEMLHPFMGVLHPWMQIVVALAGRARSS